MKTQTWILDNRLYYTRKIELHRKGKKSRTVRITPILIHGICCSPPPNWQVWHKAFFWSVRALFFQKYLRPRRHSPLLGAPQAPGDESTPQGGKSLGGRPLCREAVLYFTAADNTAGRSANRHLERYKPRLICGIYSSPHPTGQCGTRPFYGGSGRRAVADTRPAFPKNANGPVGIPLIRGASGAG